MTIVTAQPGDMRPVLLADALVAVRAQLAPSHEPELVPLARACGRILASDVAAVADLPPWDSSAVDGFALKAADLTPGELVTFRVVGEALAGHPFDGPAQTGQAVRILTGAQLPQGADLVVMQENCLIDGDAVKVRADGCSKSNWRHRG
jgi:molybdopterin molybdotransferase